MAAGVYGFHSSGPLHLLLAFTGDPTHLTRGLNI